MLPSWQKNFTSDDYVDYTWHAPTVRLFTGRPMLSSPKPGYEYPNWAYLAMGGRPELIDPGMFLASKTIAATALDLLTKPEELAKCKAEFEERTGGGVGGRRGLRPCCPPTSSRQSICAGRNTSTPFAARSGGFPLPTRLLVSRSGNCQQTCPAGSDCPFRVGQSPLREIPPSKR
ncbi:MAG: hypothetical protein R2848_12465 [Thermomicrobiales bacterium]